MNPSDAVREKGMSFGSFKIIIFVILLFIVAAIVAVIVYVFVVREKGNFSNNIGLPYGRYDTRKIIYFYPAF